MERVTARDAFSKTLTVGARTITHTKQHPNEGSRLTAPAQDNTMQKEKQPEKFFLEKQNRVAPAQPSDH